MLFGLECFCKVVWDEMVKIICEEELMCFSQKVGSSVLLEQVVSDCGMSLGWLLGVVCGDFDWIVMKMFVKDCNKCYLFVSEFVDDVVCYFFEELVQV